MSWEAWFTLAVVAGILIALVRNLAQPDLLFVAAAALFAVTGIITVKEAFAGFSNAGFGVRGTEGLAMTCAGVSARYDET